VDDRWPTLSVKNDELEQVAGTVGPEDKPADRVVTDLLNEQGVLQSVLHVLVVDAVASRRLEGIPREEAYYEILLPTPLRHRRRNQVRFPAGRRGQTTILAVAPVDARSVNLQLIRDLWRASARRVAR